MPKPKGSPKIGGKQKGTLNKSTIARIHEASQRAAQARRMGRKQAVDVLDDLLHTAMGMAVKYQPPVAGAEPANAKEFKEWLQIAGVFAKSLADFQTPKLRAMLVQMADPGIVSDKTIDQEGNVLEIDDAKQLTRIYQSMVRRVG